MGSRIEYSVFTKPWKSPLPELAGFVKSLGFDGVELPVRPGYQVEPQDVVKGLPAAQRIMADRGLRIYSVAGPVDERTIAVCAECGVPVIRICVGIDDDGYLATEARLQRQYDELVPVLDHYKVTLGIQNHCDRNICNAMGLKHLIDRYDPHQIAAVWDAAHNALNGEDPEMAIDIIWSHLCMVNLKNAYWQRVNGPEAEQAEWRPYWTLGRHGLASWPRVTAELKRRAYSGVICLPAEYSDEGAVDRLIAEDIVYAKALMQ